MRFSATPDHIDGLVEGDDLTLTRLAVGRALQNEAKGGPGDRADQAWGEPALTWIVTLYDFSSSSP